MNKKILITISTGLFLVACIGTLLKYNQNNTPQHSINLIESTKSSEAKDINCFEMINGAVYDL